MSEAGGTLESTETPQAGMGFVQRVIGVFTAPGKTFEDVAKKPTVIAPLVVLMIVIAIVSYVTFPFAIQDNPAQVAQIESLPEEQQQQQLKIFRMIGTGVGPLAVPFFTAIFALIYWGLGSLLGGEPTFKGMFSMLLFTGMITILGQFAVKLPLILIKETVAGVTFSPAALFGDLALTSTKFRILATLDLFNLWGMIVAGIGIAKVSRISVTTGIVVSAVFFVIVSALSVFLASLSG